ncbi:MAG TPA: ribulose-phosphate 3-epimerase [bacterium]|nr:ribulose-phosphate 3-epimerase [bacterium]
MIQIYPSILAADFSCLCTEIRRVEKAGVDGIHLDVMDAHFVPNLTFGPVVVRHIRKCTDLPFWAHLMMDDPGPYLEPFQKSGVQGIFVHLEINSEPRAMCRQIHSLGLKAGLAINPETPLGDFPLWIDSFERVLVMTVHPGFGGQAFMTEPLEKIRRLKSAVDTTGAELQIEVDGGIDEHTAPSVVEAGAEILVAGSAIFGAEDLFSAVQNIRKAGQNVLVKSKG